MVRVKVISVWDDFTREFVVKMNQELNWVTSVFGKYFVQPYLGTMQK